jgi:hypothetical protein
MELKRKNLPISEDDDEVSELVVSSSTGIRR